MAEFQHPERLTRVRSMREGSGSMASSPAAKIEESERSADGGDRLPQVPGVIRREGEGGVAVAGSNGAMGDDTVVLQISLLVCVRVIRRRSDDHEGDRRGQ
jgi:hypothetical protein